MKTKTETYENEQNKQHEEQKYKTKIMKQNTQKVT